MVEKNILLCGNLTSSANISPEIVIDSNYYRFYEKIDACDKKSIIVTKNQFLTQEINCCQKKSVLVKSHTLVKLFYQFATTS